MAKSQKDLKGWKYYLDPDETKASPVVRDEPQTPSRRSRRGKPTNETIVFKREADDLELKTGDSILVQEKESDSPEVALIKEIKFGNDNFIDIIVLWFIRIRDIEIDDLPKVEEYSCKEKLNPNEIFITAYLEEIQLADIIEKVNILSYKEFEQDIVIDDSNSSNTFMCRRGCDSAGELFTDVFDYRTLYQLFESDQNEFLELLRRDTVPQAYTLKKTQRAKTVKSIEERIKEADIKKFSPKKKVVQPDSGSEIESSVEYSSDSDPDDDKLDDDSDVGFSNRAKSATPRKRTKRGSSSPQKSAKTNNYTSKIDDESRQYINSVLSPLKKRLKIKQDTSKPSLLALSPKKTKNPVSFTSNNLGVDSSSDVFKEVKAKLHTSTKLSSLPCREDEFTSIYLNLETAIQEGTGCCLYVSGTPGVGKTATIREIVSQLKDLAKSNEINEFDYLEINGLKLLSPNVAYEVLWEKISGLKVSPSNAALLLEGYFAQESNRKPLVVLMDELDQIVTKKQNVMYNFFNWPTYPNSKLIVIAVANTMDLPERVLSNKISSRLGLRRIQFIGYTFEQLGEIIRHRLAMITRQNRRKVFISPDAIGFASRKVASVSGDARRALTICRRAVEIAEKEYLSNKKCDDEDETYHVQISHISRAINETINSPISQFLSSLPFASKLVLAAVLLRMKRSGLAENTLGDIIDEMKNSLLMLTSKEGNKALDLLDSKANLVNLLYGNALIDNVKPISVRVLNFKHIITELTENGILVQQNVQSERYRLITLNVSEEEILTVLKRDKEISGII